VIDEVRRLGGEVLHGWAEGRIARTGEEAVAEPETRRAGKKLRWQTTFGAIAAEEPLFRAGTRLQRPFAASAAVSHRGCSQPLQRAVTDFGADVSFAQAAEKLREHYGVELAPETIRGIVVGHAQAMLEQQQAALPQWPDVPGVAQLVAEVDGGMVPIVVTDTEQADRRTGKSLGVA